MVFLTFAARPIHNSLIPNVRVFRLPHEKFEQAIYLEDGTVSYTDVRHLLSIPKYLYEQGEIYIIENQVINDEERTVAKLTSVLIGRENDEYYEVINTNIKNELFIKTSNKPLQNGIEVHVTYYAQQD